MIVKTGTNWLCSCHLIKGLDYESAIDGSEWYTCKSSVQLTDTIVAVLDVLSTAKQNIFS